MPTTQFIFQPPLCCGFRVPNPRINTSAALTQLLLCIIIDSLTSGCTDGLCRREVVVGEPPTNSLERLSGFWLQGGFRPLPATVSLPPSSVYHHQLNSLPTSVCIQAALYFPSFVHKGTTRQQQQRRVFIHTIWWFLSKNSLVFLQRVVIS